MDELEVGGSGGGGGFNEKFLHAVPQHRLSVRLGPQAIVVNPYPAGPRTQFPASLIENDGPFLVRVNKTRSHL